MLLPPDYVLLAVFLQGEIVSGGVIKGDNFTGWGLILIQDLKLTRAILRKENSVRAIFVCRGGMYLLAAMRLDSDSLTD
jgi:hypothetical protein